MASCEACGAEAPGGASFCPVCGYQLGEAPGRCARPPVVNVRIVDSPWRSCSSCLTWTIALFVLALLAGWLAASC